MSFPRKLVCGFALALTLAAVAAEQPASPPRIELLRQYTDVANAVKANYVDPIETKKLIEGSVLGMVAGLDQDSAYLDKKALAELQYGTAGVGLEVGMAEGSLRVVAAIEGTPAFRGGVLKGDLVFKIDETEVKEMTLAHAVGRLRGIPGSTVTLSILRQGEKEPLSITLKREQIRVGSVKTKRLEPGYGYVRLTQFQDDTAADLIQQLQRLYQQGNLEGLLLDLRNNSGGLFLGAVSVSSAFLPQNTLIVSTDGPAADAKRAYRATPEDYLGGSQRIVPLENLPAETKVVPLVVLVNRNSAAASEIVAGALQDYKRAVIVGTPTFGRASIQSLLPLSNGSALKLTTSHWYTPNGRMVQSIGIIPDINFEDSSLESQQGTAGDDRQLSQALGVLKKIAKH